MITVYSMDFRGVIQEVQYERETEKFFIKKNQSRDAKQTSYSFLSTNKQEVIDYYIAKHKRLYDNHLNKLNAFEEDMQKELLKRKKDCEYWEGAYKKALDKYGANQC